MEVLDGTRTEFNRYFLNLFIKLLYVCFSAASSTQNIREIKNSCEI